VVRRYYGAGEELFEVTVTTHPEGRYTYTMDMQRSLRPRV
jgi:GntR family transcriptional regulator